MAAPRWLDPAPEQVDQPGPAMALAPLDSKIDQEGEVLLDPDPDDLAVRGAEFGVAETGQNEAFRHGPNYGTAESNRPQLGYWGGAGAFDDL